MKILKICKKTFIWFILVIATVHARDVILTESRKITISHQNVEFSNPVYSIDGTTYVPVRDIANILGYDVVWDKETDTVNLALKKVPNDLTEKREGVVEGTEAKYIYSGTTKWSLDESEYDVNYWEKMYYPDTYETPMREYKNISIDDALKIGVDEYGLTEKATYGVSYIKNIDCFVIECSADLPEHLKGQVINWHYPPPVIVRRMDGMILNGRTESSKSSSPNLSGRPWK